jgi:hypothetical protein
MGSNRAKFSSGPGKRQGGFKSENNSSGVAILNMAVDSRSLFHRSAPRLLPRGENNHMMTFSRVSFRKQIENSRVCCEMSALRPHGRLLGGTRNQPAVNFLMRAVRCAAKQHMLQAELGNLALTDELTGLYNRRGFMARPDRIPGRVHPQSVLGHFTPSKRVIHPIEIIWQPAMLQGEERAASVIRAPASNTPITELR